jgi:hypothetical protein
MLSATCDNSGTSVVRKNIGCIPDVNPQLYSLLVDGCHVCSAGNQHSSLVWLQVGSARRQSTTVEECGSNLLLRLEILFGRRPSPAPAVLAAPRRAASPPTWRRRRGPQLSAPAVEDERLSAATGGREALHLHGHRVPAACVMPFQGGDARRSSSRMSQISPSWSSLKLKSSGSPPQ